MNESDSEVEEQLADPIPAINVTPTTSRTSRKASSDTPQKRSKWLSEFNGNSCRHCPYTAVGKGIRSCNAQRHIDTRHPAIYERILNEPSAIVVTDVKRCFVLFAATSTFSMAQLENLYLQVNFSCSCCFH